MEIILTVIVCVWIFYKSGIMTGDGWLTHIGDRPAHAPTYKGRRKNNQTEEYSVPKYETPIVQIDPDVIRRGITKEEMSALAARYNMQLMHHPITDKIQGVYCASKYPIPELNELFETGLELPTLFTWTRRFGTIYYQFYWPKEWVAEYRKILKRD